jgi:hypothetical protein
MKLNKIFVKLMAVAAAVGLGASALAQGGFDFYSLDKTIAFTVTNTSAATACYTQPIAIAGRFIGSAFIDVAVFTNYSTNTLTVVPQTSNDTTNWTTLTNYAISTNYSLSDTNTYYSGGTTGALLATNLDVFPFQLITPTAATAGFAAAYSLPQPFTNSGVFTPIANGLGVSGVETNGITRIGIQNVADLSHYFRLVITNTGTNEFMATFHGRRR